MLVRKMLENDLDFVLKCVADEGWLGETLYSFQSFRKYDAKGCLIAEEEGQRIGICVAVSYGKCGFLGELIIVKNKRNCGFGGRLLDAGIHHLKKLGGRSIYLDGVTPAVPLYKRFGFKHLCKSLRFIGRIQSKTYSHVRPMIVSDLDVLASIDLESFGADRKHYLASRLMHYPKLCKTITVNNEVAGYIMGLFGKGVVSIGPWLVSENVERPLDLLESLAMETGDYKLRIGILESNEKAACALRSFDGLIETEPSWRMVLGEDAGLGDSKRLFAIGSAAKG